MNERKPERNDELVTVVVPTYNGARFLEQTLDSLAVQDYPHLEVIVVDDGSTDASPEIAREHPVVDEVVRQPNFGAAVARNRGLARAHGRWISFLDQDDLWHTSRVRTLVDLAQDECSLASATSELTFGLESDRAALVRLDDGRADWIEQWVVEGEELALARTPLPDEAQPALVEHITVGRFMAGAAAITTSFLYDRETAIAAGGCAPHARALDDHVLAANVARINGGSIPRTPAKLLFYRIHPASASTVSPLVGPVLSTIAAMRLGGVFPSKHEMGHNLEHLLYNSARSDLARMDQLALITLNVPSSQRLTWYKRWLARTVGLRK